MIHLTNFPPSLLYFPTSWQLHLNMLFIHRGRCLEQNHCISFLPNIILEHKSLHCSCLISKDQSHLVLQFFSRNNLNFIQIYLSKNVEIFISRFNCTYFSPADRWSSFLPVSILEISSGRSFIILSVSSWRSVLIFCPWGSIFPIPSGWSIFTIPSGWPVLIISSWGSVFIVVSWSSRPIFSGSILSRSSLPLSLNLLIRNIFSIIDLNLNFFRCNSAKDINLKTNFIFNESNSPISNSNNSTLLDKFSSLPLEKSIDRCRFISNNSSDKGGKTIVGFRFLGFDYFDIDIVTASTVKQVFDFDEMWFGKFRHKVEILNMIKFKYFKSPEDNFSFKILQGGLFLRIYGCNKLEQKVIAKEKYATIDNKILIHSQKIKDLQTCT